MTSPKQTVLILSTTHGTGSGAEVVLSHADRLQLRVATPPGSIVDAGLPHVLLLTGNPLRHSQMGRASRQHFEKAFPVQRMVDDYASAWKESTSDPQAQREEYASS